MPDATAPAPRLEIDLAAFEHNVRTLTRVVAPARVMLAVKANGYGHGMLPIARTALQSGADSLAVLDIPAGLALRSAGVSAPLFAWLHGRASDFAAAVRADIDLGVSAPWQLDAIARVGGGRIHLKVDTGLHRNGSDPEQWPDLVRAAVRAERAGRVEIGAIWSHLADTSPEDDAEALTRFHEAVSVAESLGCRPPLLHLAASSAAIREPEARFGLVRLGIAAYGISPFDDQSGGQLGLVPVMTLRAPVSAVRGRTATIGIGSSDGVPPPAVGAAQVWLGGQRRPIVALGIDELTIDTGGLAVTPGDDVVLFGSGEAGEPTAEEWAEWAGTIGDEIVAARGVSRLPLRYLGG